MRGEAATLRYVLCNIQLLVWAYSFLYRPTIPGSLYLALIPFISSIFHSIQSLIIITPLRHKTDHINTSNTTLSSIIMPGYIVRPPPHQPLHLSQPTNPSSSRLPSSPPPPTTKSLRTSLSPYNHNLSAHKIQHLTTSSAKQDAVKQGGKIGHEYNSVFKGFS